MEFIRRNPGFIGDSGLRSALGPLGPHTREALLLGKNPQKIAIKPGLGGLSEFDPIQSIISLFAANPNCDAGPICAERAGPSVSFLVILSTFHHEILRRDAWDGHRRDDGASRALAAGLQARNYRGTAIGSYIPKG